MPVVTVMTVMPMVAMGMVPVVAMPALGVESNLRECGLLRVGLNKLGRCVSNVGEVIGSRKQLAAAARGDRVLEKLGLVLLILAQLVDLLLLTLDIGLVLAHLGGRIVEGLLGTLKLRLCVTDWLRASLLGGVKLG